VITGSLHSGRAPRDGRAAGLRRLLALLACLLLPAAPLPAQQQEASPSGDGASSVEVLRAFAKQKEEQRKEFTDQEKRQIMFFMGVALLALLVATAALGIAMALYGKQVFVAHMLLAGLTVTLAIAHTVVALVWFFPF